MTRPARALVALDALRHNHALARAAAPGRKVLAVVKADGYGHGAPAVAGAIADADGFGVARVHEGLELRAAGVEAPVVVLSGAWSTDDVEAAAGAALEVVLHHEEQLRAFESARSRPGAWLKVDTGMHRLGFEPLAATGARARIGGALRVLMTHLASADDRRDPATRAQMVAFEAACEGFDGERSAANSAGILGWPETHCEWVRPGIMLYGISPFRRGTGAELGLRPVMTLSTRLVAVNRLRRGEAVGYGGTWVCPEDMPLGVAAIGYGDGYPRHAPAGTPVLVGGERAEIVGRVSMDLVTIDLRRCPRARVGEQVVMWGDDLPAEEVAAHVGTIAYELVTRVASRVERVAV